MNHTPSRRSFITGSIAGAAGAFIAGTGFDPGHLAAQGFARERGQKGDPTGISITDAADEVRRRRISPVDLTSACLQRIERLNPGLNAFITVTSETAMAHAREAEIEIRRGRWRGPLHGIPIGLKDNIDTSGTRTTAASSVFMERIPTEDATVVRRLRAAGAVLIGKLNLEEFAIGPDSTISAFGPTRNPWNREHITGGSSGGAAAALSARLCYGALGTDTGGSIRGPAGHCGIVGLKPTYGLVSARGVVPLSWTLDHVGPMARNVEDTALLLSVIAGYDRQDSASLEVPPKDYAAAIRTRVSGLRIGIARDMFTRITNPEIRAAVNDAVAMVRSLTATVDEVELPPIKDGLWGAVTSAEAYAFHSQFLATVADRYSPAIRFRVSYGSTIGVKEYIEARREVERLRRAIQTVFSSVDLLMAPGHGQPASTIEESLRVPVDALPPRAATSFNAFNIYGLPTIAMPCGFTSKGLPVGLQMSAPHFGEQKLFALAHAFQQKTAWHTRVPVL